MKKSDFEFSANAFNGVVNNHKRTFAIAWQCMLNAISSWPSFAISMLHSNATIEIDDETKSVRGSVLERPFAVNFGLIATDEHCRVEAIITAPSLKGDASYEIGRFYFGSDGTVFSSDQQILLRESDQFLSYSLLVAVLRKVLSTPREI